MQSNKDWRMWTIFIIKFSCFAEIDKSKKVKKTFFVYIAGVTRLLAKFVLLNLKCLLS